ncbi:hypothetical protein At1g04090-like [Arachis stenosperma]|uniref:hypothetical protein At1g04090-like n=1 Tax=Arachis stenosperma TaxID=217475 RepID=UPI0025AB86CB|nr:hypothetical protein At1g04090-like [Arachis stenosperma]
MWKGPNYPMSGVKYESGGVVFMLFFLSTTLTTITRAMEVPKITQRFHFPGNPFKKKHFLPPPPVPIQKKFNLPAAVPVWPPGNGFSNGSIDLGGLQVSQITTFNKVWASQEGGAENQGATIFEPSGIPQGFSMLGSYSQPNNKALFGWVLVAKDLSPPNTINGTLKQPIDYSLIWTSENLGIKQDTNVYVWTPAAPDGYKAVGHVVTTSADKPALNKVMCVRIDLTDQCEKNSVIWNGPNGINFFEARPSNRGTQSPSVQVGTFVAQNVNATGPLTISCLKNTKSIASSMPNVQQIEAIVKAYSPIMYLHPHEEFLPSSVNWFFSNGALLFTRGNESNPVAIAQNGTNLPQDPNNDGAFWLDLPADAANKDRVKKGNLESARSYIHVKPMLGGTFSDIAMWVFYPFNGPARAKVDFFNINLGKIGEHVGDWEHVTLRVSNFNGELWQMYFSQHSHGQWVEASQLEFHSGNNNNKPVVYSSLHGHACYPHAGLVLQGTSSIGVRNDTDSSNIVMDLGLHDLVSAEYLGSQVVEPPWLNYFREWGPKVDYDIDDELKKVAKALPGRLRSLLDKVVKSLPSEVLGEEGPTGPKVKNNWNGDEV